MSDHSSGYIGSDGRARYGPGGDATHHRRRHRHRHRHHGSEDDKVDSYGPGAVAIRRHALQRVPEAHSDVSSEVEYEYDHRDRRYEDIPRRHREDRRRNGRDHRTGIIVGLVILLASFILCWRGNEDSDDDD